MATKKPARVRNPLPGISSRAWEHPADRGALVAMRKLRGFDALLKALSGLIKERQILLVYLGSSVRVDERQFPQLHTLLADVGAVLDVDDLPTMFVRADPSLGAMTIGMDKPIIVLNSGLVDLLDDDELRFVIAHELGHAVSGHAVYRTLLTRLVVFSAVLAPIPGGMLGLRAVTAALMEWARKAELSADRAGLLATQDPAVATRVHMKLASGGHLDDLDVASFFEQAAEYDATEDLRDSVLKLLLVENQSHPFAVIRALELRRWVESGSYTAILGGDYPQRADDGSAKVSEAAQEAASAYSEAFRKTEDALGRLVHDVAGFIGSAKVWLDDKLRREGDPGDA